MRTPARKQRGVAALMSVLFLLFILGTVLVIAHQMAATDVHDSGAQNNSVEALFLAESGLERAAWRFANGTACAALAEAAMPPVPPGRGQFIIAAGQSTDFNGAALPANQCRVRATGQIAASNVARTIEGIVQTGASASVQSGSVTMNPATRTVTIPVAVNIARSFVVCQNRTDTSNASNRVTCELTGPTSLTITAGAVNAGNTVQWYVVEFFNGVTVQRGLANFANGNSTIDVTLLTAVTLGQTFALTTERTNWNDQDRDERWTTTATLTAATNLQLARNENGNSIAVAWQVVQMNGATVQSGTAAITSNQFSTAVPIAAVNPASSFLIFTRRGRNGVNGRESNYQVRGELTNNTTLTFTRTANPNQANRSVDISWFLVSLADGTAVQRGTGAVGPNTATQNAAIAAIDTTRSVPFISASGGPGGSDTADLDSTSWAADFQTAISLRLRRGPAGGLDAASQVAWFVVQFPNASNSIIQWRELP